MKAIKFYKYQGTGNDFIIFDNRAQNIETGNYHWFAKICDRRFGIGADGVMVLENNKECDFTMLYYNADGKPGSMCGNGGRCMVNFVRKLGITKETYLFEAVDGMHSAKMEGEIVHLKMLDVDVINAGKNHWELNTGSPHYVTFVNKLENLDVIKLGAEIRYNEIYKEKGINVNFLEDNNEVIAIRTYERGVEDETLSCGTGVTASAICVLLEKKLPAGKHTISLQTMGGELKVQLIKTSENTFRDIWLIGTAEFVYEGLIDYNL